MTQQELRNFEAALNSIEFRGTPVGNLVLMTLYLDVFLKNNDFPLSQYFKDLATYYYTKLSGARFFKKARFQPNDAARLKNKWLFTFLSSKPHLFSMHEPIVRNIDPGQCLALVYERGLQKQLAHISGLENHYYLDLPQPDLLAWRKEFNRIAPNLKKVIAQQTEACAASRRLKARLMSELAVQTQILMALEDFLKIIRPKVIVTESDRFSTTAPLILAAKKLDIATFTLMHGVIYNFFGYLPLLADYFIAWGDLQRQQLIQEGANPAQLLVGGAPQLSNKVSFTKTEICAKLGLPDNKKIILLGSSNVFEPLRNKVMAIFCEGVSQLPDCQGVVKLHPSEKKEYYADFIRRYPQIIFYNKEELGYEESFALADVVCIFSTAYGFDAVLKKKPLLIINVDDNHLGNSTLLIQNGIPSVKNAVQLVELLQHVSILYDVEKIDSYCIRYCESFGDESAHTILSLVRERIDKKTPALFQ
jgi:hypothetical protein